MQNQYQEANEIRALLQSETHAAASHASRRCLFILSHTVCSCFFRENEETSKDLSHASKLKACYTLLKTNEDFSRSYHGVLWFTLAKKVPKPKKAVIIRQCFFYNLSQFCALNGIFVCFSESRRSEFWGCKCVVFLTGLGLVHLFHVLMSAFTGGADSWRMHVKPTASSCVHTRTRTDGGDQLYRDIQG